MKRINYTRHQHNHAIKLKLMAWLFVMVNVYWLSSCRPQDEVATSNPSAAITTSTDTVRFDTVITSLWSPTRRLRIYNPNDQAITISSITLGPNTPFSIEMYVNGRPGTSQSNILLRGKDSLLILISVNLRNTQAGLPFLLRDSLTIRTHGIAQPKTVQLEAWGQNAIFFDGDSLTADAVWDDQERPYYLKNSFLVGRGKTLTIKEGVKVYNFASSNLIVLGRLLVQGTAAKPVIFTGTRQEARFDLQPDQWGAIAILEESRGSRIEHAIIKNGLRGIQVGIPQSSQVPECYIRNCLIRAHSEWGICAFGGAITAINNIVLDCGINAFGAYQGGTYTLIHNTLGYSNIFGFKRDNPALGLFDFFEFASRQFAFGKLDIALRNNLVVGGRNNEFVRGILNNSLGHVVRDLSGNAIRTDTNRAELTSLRNTILSGTFRFNNVTNGDFAYDTVATLPRRTGIDLNEGSLLQAFPEAGTDFYGKPRNLITPDPGAINAMPREK